MTKKLCRYKISYIEVIEFLENCRILCGNKKCKDDHYKNSYKINNFQITRRGTCLLHI